MTAMIWISTGEHSACGEMCWRLYRHMKVKQRSRIEFFGDEVDRIAEIDILTGEIKDELKHVAIFPASHYVVDKENIKRAVHDIEEELDERVKEFKRQDKLLEAQRIAERTNFDIEMLKETGFCSGIENYSRHLAGLAPGQPPYTLIDYFSG